MAEEELVCVHCGEQGFSLMIPPGKTAYWEEDVGFRVSVEEPGYVPYIAVYRRPTKLNDPVNFLNNVYREYMENRYDNSVGTNPCRSVEIGGKTLYSATYHYQANGNQLCLTLMIEVREDGDVEYHAKYAEGAGEPTMAVLDTVVRFYQPDGTPTDALRPIDRSGQAIDTAQGCYWARLSELDRIMDGGYFTLSLYTEDVYPAEKIEALRPGNAVRVFERTFTVDALKAYEDGSLELIPREKFDGYIAFLKEDDGYTALVNDRAAVTFLANFRVMLPLSNDFTFSWVTGAEESAVYDADAFIDLAGNPETSPVFSQYNTMVQFRDGMLTMLLHADYPADPE